MMTRIDEIKKRKKSKIRKSALELFSENGYFQTSIADISKKANISKGLFYDYYSSKKALFKEIVLISLESILNYLPNDNKQEFNDIELACFLNKTIILSLKKEQSKWRLLTLLLSQQVLFERMLIHLMKSKVYIEFGNILQKYFKEKGYENPEIEVKLFISTLMGICIQYTTNPVVFPINKVMEQFINRIISKS